jgi:hypothetical protein
MDMRGSMEVSPPQPLFGRALRAVAVLDASTKLSMLCIVFGWFFLNTLVVSLGVLEHGVRFFDMGAIMVDPTRLFFGVDTAVQRLLFGLICLACALAPVAPRLVPKPWAWLAYLAPLALMLVCGVVLYSRTSGEFFAAPSDAKSVSGNLVHFANNLVHQGSGLISRHISVGAGAYLALIGSVVLAVQGIRGVRHRP